MFYTPWVAVYDFIALNVIIRRFSLEEQQCMWYWGMCGALVESTPFIRRVMGLTPSLAAT